MFFALKTKSYFKLQSQFLSADRWDQTEMNLCFFSEIPLVCSTELTETDITEAFSHTVDMQSSEMCLYPF